MSDRFFPATAMGGRLYPRDVSDHGPWDPARIAYLHEREIDMTRIVAVKIRTVEELDSALSDSRDRPGLITLYVHEDLLGEARKRWEKMREDVRRPS